MTATDELRNLLDERGIEHEDYAYVVPETQERCEITRVRDFAGRFKARFMSCNEPGKVDVACKLTPAQAIAATLGEPEIVRCRDCKHYENTGNCHFWSGYEPIPGGDEYTEVLGEVTADGYCAWGERRDA